MIDSVSEREISYNMLALFLCEVLVDLRICCDSFQYMAAQTSSLDQELIWLL